MEVGEPHINPTEGKKRASGKDLAVQEDCGPCCPIPALPALPLVLSQMSARASIPLQNKGKGRELNPPWTDPIRCGASNAAEGAGVIIIDQETAVRLESELIYSWRPCDCFWSLG